MAESGDPESTTRESTPDDDVAAESNGAAVERPHWTEPPADNDYVLVHDAPNPTLFPRLLPDVDPVGGVIKVYHEDFVVDEVPLYDACGEGEHVYATIRKRNRTTLQVRNILAHELGVHPEDIGFAGHKDKRGVTTQRFSIVGVDEEDVRRVDGPFEVLEVTRHRNKLRSGHLKANRFRIRVRAVLPGALERAEMFCDALRRWGVPNFYGGQRFGHGQVGYKVGAALLRRDPKLACDLLVGPGPGLDDEFRRHYAEGDIDRAIDALPPGRLGESAALRSLKKHPGNERSAMRRIPRQLKRMYFSAYQSFLFNWSLLERWEWGEHAYARPELGDLVWVHGPGAVFRVDDLEAARAQAEAGEISPTGPMFGRRMRFPEGREGLLEGKILEAEGLRPQSFVSHVKGLQLDGTRRAYRYPVADIDVRTFDAGEPGVDALEFRFTLPSGAYATTLLDQILGEGQVERRFDDYYRERGLPVPERYDELDEERRRDVDG